MAAEIFVASTYPESTKAMGSLFDEEPTTPSLAPPAELIGEDAENEIRRTMYFELFMRHLTKKETLTNHLHSFFTILWGQCSPGIQSKMRSSVQFLSKKENGGCAWLIEKIRQVIFNFTPRRYRLMSFSESKVELLWYQQGYISHPSVFRQVHWHEWSGGSFGEEKGILNFVDKYDLRVIDVVPASNPVSPVLPPFVMLRIGENFSRDEVTTRLKPYDEYFDLIRDYQSSLRRWERKDRKYR